MRRVFSGMSFISAYVAVALLLITPKPSWPQAETGQITGTVTDPTGAVVPNVTVTAKNTATGVSRATTTSTAGVYVIPNLPPGDYQVTFASNGFTTQKQTVTVGVGARVGADAHLEVGTASTVVEVAAGAVQVNTETQTLGSTLTTQEITQLPSLTRNPYDFVAAVPNVSPADPSGRGVGYAINGMRAAGTNVLLDGVPNNDEFSATVGQQVPLDSVQEYSVLTSDFTAEVGRADAGVVNVVTRSGTNNFHGTAYEFNRVSALGSNSFYNNANSLPKSIYTRNQFGYSIGGPIKKDKLFFFQNTEWTRVRSYANEVDMIPSPQLIAAAAPATQAFFSSYGTLRPGLGVLATYSKNQLLAAGTNVCRNAAAGGPCNLFPGDTPMFEKVAYSTPADAGGGFPQNTYDLVGNVDYDMTDRTQLSFRYALYNENDFAGTINTSPYRGYETGQTNVDNRGTVSVVHSISPSFVSQTRVSFNRLNLQQPLGTAPVGPTLYMSSSTAPSLLGNSIAFPGYNEFTPGNAIPFGGPQNFWTILEDLSKSHGSHDFRFGGQFTYFRDNRTFGAYQEAVEGLGTNGGNELDNFLLGQLRNFTAAVNPQGKYPGQTVTLPVGPPNFSRSNRYDEGALYAQDSWKFHSRMTLNLGIRWEYYGVQHNKNQALDSNFYPAGDVGTLPTPQSIANGQVYLATQSPLGMLWQRDWHDFAPHVGFAWDIFGDGKTSFRAGYGIGYERNFGNVTFNLFENPPNFAVINVTSGTTGFATIPVTTSNAGPLAGNSGTVTLPRATLRAVNPDIVDAYAHTFSASLEHQFGQSVVASLSYSGSMGENLYSITNYNLVGSGNAFLGIPCTPGGAGDPGTCTAYTNQQYGGINVRGNGGISNYNAGIVRVVARNIHHTGITFDANYTYSHAIDNLSGTFSDGQQTNFVLGFLDPYAPGLDRGNADFDIRQRVVVSGIFQTPAVGKGWTNRVLGGWQLAPIFTAHTGSPFTLYDCTNAYNQCPRAAVIGPVPTSGVTNVPTAGIPDNYQYYQFGSNFAPGYYNPKFGISDFGPFPSGMLARNSVYGPGNWNVNVGLYKTTKLTERFNLQLRLELYNAFNHANFYLNTVDADISSNNFVDGYYNGNRNLQLGAKLVW